LLLENVNICSAVSIIRSIVGLKLLGFRFGYVMFGQSHERVMVIK